MTHKLTLLVTVMIGTLVFTACSPSAAEKLNKNGNEAFGEQAFDQALALYQSAQIEEPELAEAYYNAANALYRQGDYAAALEQLQMALSFAEDKTLAESSFFNLGNSAYSAQDNENAIAAYTEALLLNPADQDAKYNLELALQQQQEQQEQEQESDGGEGEEEQKNQDPSEGEEGQEEQDQQEGEDPSEGGQDGEEEQDSEESENGDEQQEGEGQDGEQEPQDGEQGDEPQDQQGQGQGQPGQEDPNGEQQPGVVPAPGERMSEEQARQLLAAIAGNSDTLAERLGQMFTVPWRPPVQDW